LNCESINIEISSNPKFVSIVRLTASGIANKMGFSIEDIDDIKVSLSEACTNVIKHTKAEKMTISFNLFEDRLEILVNDNGKGYDYKTLEKPRVNNLKESGMGIFIIESLMDEVFINSNDNQGTTINMIKYLGVGV